MKSEIVHQSENLMLVHGDCRNMEVLQDGSVDLVVTDPP